MRIRARARLDALLEAGGRHEIGQEVLSIDSLKFKETKRYTERLRTAAEATGETDAMVVMSGAIHFGADGSCFEFDFMGDLVIAEPKVLIAFTGARVIKSTLGVSIPDGYRRSWTSATCALNWPCC